MTRLALAVLLLPCIAPAATLAQGVQPQAEAIAPGDPIPLDPEVRSGKLPSGLTYYVQRHTEPAKRAELRLVVNAGALQEDDDQQGMAHLIEHMGFNGTAHFKKNDLIDYLRSVGVRFGADLNAGTSYDETVYMLQIPTDTARLLDQGILVLADWANGFLFDSAEVANERGVVVEEWRGAQGAGFRMSRKLSPIIYRGSRYAVRNVIGSEQSIMSATVPLLRRYYDDWYRPDLQAVIVVGDVDVARVEGLIRQHFGSLAPRANPRPRIRAELPDNSEPLIGIASDREASSTSVGLAFKLPRLRVQTAGDYRQRLVEGLFGSMLRSRLGEIARRPDAPFLFAGAGKGGFTRSREAFTLSASAKDGGAERALEALVVEARRVEQFGFLQSELDRARAGMLRGFEQSYAERDKRPSGAIVGAYIGHFLDGGVAAGPEYFYRAARQFLPTVTLAEVNALIRQWITPDNRVIIVQSPEKAGLRIPTEADMLAAVDRAMRTSVVAYSENVSTEPLVPRLPPAGRIVSAKTRTDVGITEWVLSNGARVIVKPTDFRADQVLFGAYSPGGTTLLPDADVLDAQFATSIVTTSGVGRFNRTDLGKRLTGKAVGVAPSIGGLSEGINGSASPRDIETLFELVHLYFTAPRLDTAAVQAMMNQQRAMLENRGASPESQFFDTVNVTMTSYHPRSQPLTLERLGKVSPEHAFALYKDRFADAGDFTFVFVGNVDTTALKPLVARYLATLPATGRKEGPLDSGIRPPVGVVEKTLRKGTEPKSLSRVIFTGPFEWSPANVFAMNALMEVVRFKLIETLREGMSGTYSPGISGFGTKLLRPEYRITISYGSSPENSDKLFKAALAIIDTMKMQGPTQAEIDKVREQMRRGREVALKQNGFWMGTILSHQETGEDIASVLGPHDRMLADLAPAQVRDAARRWFNTNNYARFVLLPETTPAKTQP